MREKALDISRWQDTLDASRAKAAGITTILCRACYGTGKDARWDAFAPAVKAAGLRLGAYGFATWHYKSANGGSAGAARAAMRAQTDALIALAAGAGADSWVAWYYADPNDPDFDGCAPLAALPGRWGDYLRGLGQALCGWQFGRIGRGEKYGVGSANVDRACLCSPIFWATASLTPEYRLTRRMCTLYLASNKEATLCDKKRWISLAGSALCILTKQPGKRYKIRLRSKIYDR